MARLAIEIDADYTGKSEVKAAANDIKQIGDAGKGAAPGIESAGKASSGLASTLKGLVGAGALLAAGKMMLDFGKASLMAASDVQEMQSKFNTVFKSLAGDVTAELQEFADAANRSIYDLQGFAATLQDTFVPLGFARDSAADMSIQLVKLAEDLASFNNLPTQQVVEDLQSALVGNTETLRKYGVVATQAAIDEKALAMGLEFTKGRMDAETKALAILQIALDSTTDAQGDAIKTADSYANVSKGLEAATLDLSVAIGENLVGSATKAKIALTELVSTIASEVTANNQLKAAVEAGIITQEKANLTMSEMRRAADPAAVAAAALAEAQEETAKQTKELTTGLEMSSAEMAAWTGRATQATFATQEAKAAAAALAAEYEFTTAVIADNLAENERLGVSHEDIAAAEQRRIDIAAELAEKQRELAATSGDVFAANVNNAEALVAYNNELGASVTNQDAINQALFEAADAAGADATQLAILGGALGLYSEEAVEAALQTAIIQAKITELAAAYVDGSISVDEMRIELRNFTNDLSSTVGGVGELTGAIDGIERDISIHVGWNVDPAPNLPGGGMGDLGSQGGAIAMQSGGIVPGSFAQAVPITAHGGEMILNPTQQAALFGMLNGGGQGGMGQGITIQIINQGVTGENVAAKTQQGVLGAMRQVGQY